jgi:hypothetical protein
VDYCVHNFVTHMKQYAAIRTLQYNLTVLLENLCCTPRNTANLCIDALLHFL